MTFRWGIIGAGGIARVFAKDLIGTSHEIHAIGSRSLQSARDFGFGKVFYGSYEELAHDSDIDAIYIATPHSHHYENALLTLNAGKPTLVEKAFTINARQARELIDLSRSTRVPLMEAMWTRFLPHIHQVRTIIDSGVLGTITYLEASHGQNLPRTKAERLWNPELGGGALLDLGVYPVSLASMVFGKPSTITSHAILTDENVDAATSVILSYANGGQATLSCTMLAATSNSATIAGSQGRIEISGPFYRPNSFTVIQGDSQTEYPNTYSHGGWREEAFEIERLTRSGEIESPLMSHRETLEIMETMDEIRRQSGVRYSCD